jgi:hypothetical protein
MGDISTKPISWIVVIDTSNDPVAALEAPDTPKYIAPMIKPIFVLFGCIATLLYEKVKSIDCALNNNLHAIFNQLFSKVVEDSNCLTTGINKSLAKLA